MKHSVETLNFSSRGYPKEENRFSRKRILKHDFKLQFCQEVQSQGRETEGEKEMVEG